VTPRPRARITPAINITRIRAGRIQRARFAVTASIGAASSARIGTPTIARRRRRRSREVRPLRRAGRDTSRSWGPSMSAGDSRRDHASDHSACAYAGLIGKNPTLPQVADRPLARRLSALTHRRPTIPSCCTRAGDLTLGWLVPPRTLSSSWIALRRTTIAERGACLNQVRTLESSACRSYIVFSSRSCR